MDHDGSRSDWLEHVGTCWNTFLLRNCCSCCSCCSCRFYTRLYTYSYISVCSSLKVFRDSHSNLFISSFCQELLPDLPRSQLRATTVKGPQGSGRTHETPRKQRCIAGVLKDSEPIAQPKKDSREGNWLQIGCRC